MKVHIIKCDLQKVQEEADATSHAETEAKYKTVEVDLNISRRSRIKCRFNAKHTGLRHTTNHRRRRTHRRIEY